MSEATETKRPKPAQGVAAVERALQIMAVFTRANEPVRLTEISTITGLYKSTTLRLLASLEQYGYVRRLSDGRYQVGPTTFALGRAYQNAFKLSDFVLPVLRELVEAGTESASFHVRDEEVRVCLYRVESQHSTVDRLAAGDLLPLDRGAPGRVLLAFEGRSGEPYETIRHTYHAVSYGERDTQCAAVSAPVFSTGDRLVGALSLSGPASRFTEDRVAWLTEMVTEAAARLTRSLGGNSAKFPG